MRRRWTKTDKTLFLVYAGVIMCFARLNSTYQSCVDFQPFLVLAFVLVFAGGILIKNMGARKSVFAGIAAAVLLECAAVYAILPADTYAEGGPASKPPFLSLRERNKEYCAELHSAR